MNKTEITHAANRLFSKGLATKTIVARLAEQGEIYTEREISNLRTTWNQRKREREAKTFEPEVPLPVFAKLPKDVLFDWADAKRYDPISAHPHEAWRAVQ